MGSTPPCPSTRRMRIGIATRTTTWTDGVSYVAIERRRLRRCLGLGLNGWCSLAMIMRHEYAHDTPTAGQGEHDLAFYQRFHDGLLHPWVSLVNDVVRATRA